MKALDPITVPLAGTTLIEASAGTGKTYTIATLFVRLLLEARLELSQILVVTYTRAATAELRDRIRRRLVEAAAAIDGARVDETLHALIAARARAGELAADRAWIARALRDFDQAAIFTIHAFCQHTLAECAFESNAPFDVELIEDQLPLQREVAIDYFAQIAYGAERALVARLLAKRARPTDLALLLGKVARDPRMPVLPDAPPETPLDTSRLHAARVRAAQLWAAEREAILGQLREAQLPVRTYPPERLQDWAGELDRLGTPPARPLPEFIGRLAQPALLAASKRLIPPRHAFFEAIAELCAAGEQLNQALDLHVLGLRRRLVDYGRSELVARRRERGVQSFDDLLQRLSAALHGNAGDALARRIAERHPAALIDEFQDTDPVQYDIFRRIHAAGGKALFLIGDPKQAIYGFRGADVFAYMHAALRAGEAVYTLDVNYRSDPRLLQALSALYAGAHRPFLLPEIRFEPVRPEPNARERLQPSAPALQLLLVPREAGNAKQLKGGGWGVINKGWGDENLPRRTAYEIVHLLHSNATISGAEVKPRHIAVLCRTNAQAGATRAELAVLGVPTVLEGDSSVFESESAEELSRVLWAVAEPADRRKLIAALATAVLGVDGAALQRLRSDETGLELWLDRIARWNQIWHERGFVQMIQCLLDDAAVQQRLLTRTDGERRLTDLLHLTELLHRVSVGQHLGPLSLLHWFTQVRNDPEASAKLAAESEQIRLEHDEHAVKLTTVHRSKGLEYPIVFCPFMWAGIFRNDADARFHDRADGDRVKFDLGSPDLDRHKQEARREEIAESLRVLYVALTRARHRVYAVWGRFNRSGESPLGYLLHQGREREHDPDEVEKRLKGLDDAALRAEIEALCQASEGSIGLRDIASDPPAPYVASELAQGELAARKATRALAGAPRMTSFSRLTADAYATALQAEDAPDHDQTIEAVLDRDLPPAEQQVAPAKVVLHAFPGGSRPGSLIHAVYEHIDFERGDPGELAAQADRLLSLFGVDAGLHRDALVRGIEASLETPLDDRDPPLALARIARAQRVDELEFTLCTEGGGALSAERLAAAFAQHGAPACDPDYAQRLRALGSIPPAAFVKGFIDLVFRHDQRYFIVDYKSNWLGEHAADYRPARLVPAMHEHHYFLQYHLYALALHRHLQLRVPGYDYERDFGGVYYLFLRGMAPEHPRGTGVFFDRPPRALIETLAAAIGAPEAES